jgi:hypothetical protein
MTSMENQLLQEHLQSLVDHCLLETRAVFIYYVVCIVRSIMDLEKQFDCIANWQYKMNVNEVNDVI